MKYVNPHTVLLTYFSEANHMKSNDTNTESGRPVYAALVDTISSKVFHSVLYRSEDAALILAQYLDIDIVDALVNQVGIYEYYNKASYSQKLLYVLELRLHKCSRDRITDF